MKVFHLCVSARGGAGIAAQRIHRGFLGSEVDSSFLCQQWPEDVESGQAVPCRRTINGLLHRLQRRWYLDNRPRGLELFSPSRRSPGVTFDDFPGQPDILHLHWVAGMFDYKRFFDSLPPDLPIVWHLHDMNPFTGGCHYARGCTRYRDGCGLCPQLAHPSRWDWSARSHAYKKRLLPVQRVHVVGASQWIVDHARDSNLLGEAASFSTIPYGLDTHVFAPRDRLACRKRLGIPATARVVCFGADYPENTRKGFRELMQALRKVRHQVSDLHLLVFGRDLKMLDETGITCTHTGYVQSEQQLSEVYSAADLFVMPSIHEVFGQVGLEAMACGLPLVAFDNGSASEMVEHRISGLLAGNGDISDLAHWIETLLNNPAGAQSMGQRGRERAIADYALDRRVQDYAALYRRALAHR